MHKLFTSDERRKIALLYHSMGTGKTLTSVQIAKNIAGVEGLCDFVIVIAVPSTHKDWNNLLSKYVNVPFMIKSHQWITKNSSEIKKLSKNTLAIVDELHLTANRNKPGTIAVEKLIAHCFASLLMSGTPFRNKEERLFVVHNWLFGNVSNYENWLHEYCNTQPDRFAYYPSFVSFKVGDIEDYLNYIDRFELKRIYVEKRDMKYKVTPEYLPIVGSRYKILEDYSVYGANELVVANSVMRKLRYMSYLKYCDNIEAENDSCKLIGARKDVTSIIKKYEARNPIVYAQSSKVAKLYKELFPNSLYIDGKTTKKNKDEIFDEYKRGGKMLFATDSVSTGTDGAQNATDCIVILYDTNDATSRDQLIARIAGGFRNKGNAEIVTVIIE